MAAILSRSPLLLVVLAFLAGPLHARADPPGKLVLVLDASGSMWGRVGGRTKIDIAREVIADLLQDWDPRVELGLTVYGHRREADCEDIESLVPVGPTEPGVILDAVASIRPRGKTPIGSAVERAAEELDYRAEPAAVVLVSDGKETCGVDVCSVAASLDERGIDFTAHVIGFDVTEEERRQLSCLARNTGGLYMAAEDAGSLRRALRAVVDEASGRASSGVWIAASLGPERQPIAEDVHWRISALGQGSTPPPAPLLDLRQATVNESLPPGRYRVWGEYRGIQGEAEISVSEGKRTRFVLDLEAGRLELSAIYNLPDQPVVDGVRWEIRRVGQEESGAAHKSEPIATSTQTPDTFVLPVGHYRLFAEYRGATLASEFALQAGDTVRKRVRFGSGRLALRAVLSAASDPITEPIHWEIRKVDGGGPGEGELVREESRPTCFLTLESGRYEVSATFGDTTARERLELKAGTTLTHTLDLAAGTARIFGVLPPPGGPIHDPVDWEIFSLSSTESGKRPVATKQSPSHSFTLPAGRYRVSGRYGDLTGTGIVEVHAGSSTSLGVVLL